MDNPDDKILRRITVKCIKASGGEALYHIVTLAHYPGKGSEMPMGSPL